MAKAKKDKENKISPTDFKDSILECLSNEKLYKFVEWYCTSDQQKKSYDVIKNYLNDVEYDFAMSNHLNRQDVQDAIKLWFKKSKDLNMLKVYNVMLNKSLEGDVKSADWIMKFNNSDFFKDEEDSEIHDFIDKLKVDINGSEDNE
ncbi:MAG TPA: hypothetical protein VIM42_03600 [Clostridium sp.]